MSSSRDQQLVDVSHSIEHGMITYRGLPGPVIRDLLSREASREHYAEGVEFQIGSIELVANTGTYLDSPFHRYADGADLSQLLLSSIANLDGLVVRALDQSERGLGISYFRDLDVTGRAVLIHTGWDVRWGSDRYFERNPFLTRDAAQFLADSGAKLVGIDSQNIDDILDLSRPVHSILLKAGIPIVEHLCNLAALPDDGFNFFAVPVKIKGMGTFPVRAFGIVK
ncbi:MAG: arylformamidase [Acidobacteriota bacterium]|jgi:kynurenine formamidase|nr:arylformamidase [Acidobacteriota bacterium]